MEKGGFSMKVFAYIGSPRGESSLGYQFLKLVKDELATLDDSIELNVFRDDLLNIKEHDGSVIDFNSGQTIYNDDMKYIEEQMLCSDFIILVSPVYAHNVSSQMKKFIDRISYWLHLFRLTGKVGYVVSVADNNGVNYVNDYLTKMMQYLGIYVLGTLGLQANKINNDQNTLSSYSKYLSKKIVASQKLKKIDIPYEQEKLFINQRNRYLKSNTDSKEKIFWEKNDYLKYDSFEKLFINKCNFVHKIE